MQPKLSQEEHLFIKEILNWDRNRRSLEAIFYHIFLVLGGAVIVVAGFITLRHPSDRTVAWVTVPGFLMGLLLIALYIIGSRRVRVRSLVVSVLQKLGARP